MGGTNEAPSPPLGICGRLFLSHAFENKGYQAFQDSFIISLNIFFLIALIITHVSRKNPKKPRFFTRMTYRVMLFAMVFIIVTTLIPYFPMHRPHAASLSFAFSKLMIIFQFMVFMFWITERHRKLRRVLDKRKPLLRLLRILFYSTIPSALVMLFIIIARFGFNVDVMYYTVFFTRNIEEDQYPTLFFWMVLNSIYILGYVSLLLIVNTKLSSRWMSNTNFVVYTCIMIAFCALELGGNAALALTNASKDTEKFSDFEIGLCILSISRTVYLSTFAPLIYFFLLAIRFYAQESDTYFMMNEKEVEYDSYASYGPFSEEH